MKVVKVLTSEFKRFCSLIFFLISDLKMKKGGGGGGIRGPCSKQRRRIKRLIKYCIKKEPKRIKRAEPTDNQRIQTLDKELSLNTLMNECTPFFYDPTSQQQMKTEKFQLEIETSLSKDLF